jgi:hypothetical protein
MAILDLQGLEQERSTHKGPPPGSRASKGCGNHSALSLLLC